MRQTIMALKLVAYLQLTKIQINFLIDPGADLCAYPRKFSRGQQYKSDYELSAANETVIKTYGTELLIFNFGLRRDFT